MKAVLRHAQQEMILTYFKKSQIDYGQYYLQLYASYNIWYRSSTGESLDARALAQLKLRHQIWKDCFDDTCMRQLRSLMRRIYVLTVHRPLVREGSAWKGVLEDETDWRGMIDFWYAIRCDVVHGNDEQLAGHHSLMVKLAHESLTVFMTEVAIRLQLEVGEDEVSSSATMRRYVYSSGKSGVDLAPSADYVRLAGM
ncbi:MAG TPA: hypothetical protein QF549_00560 [Candidatus Saccharimonadaceae bacterium]|nr:hypothetical protein [Candidatus Saccharimonadaceae bacterium]